MYRGQKHGKLDNGCVFDVISRGNYKHCSPVDDLERFHIKKITVMTRNHHFSIQYWKCKYEGVT